MQDVTKNQEEKKPRATTRKQFDFSEKMIERMERLQELLDITTLAELMRKSFNLYEWLATNLDEDDTLIIEDKNMDLKYKIPVGLIMNIGE